MGYSILVVEDDPIVSDCLRDFLGQEGHSVYGMDREAALRLFPARNLSLDLLIVNLGVNKGERGREMVRVAKEYHPEVKILLISGGTTAAELEIIARLIGADAALAKPFDLVELQAKLAELYPQGTPAGK